MCATVYGWRHLVKATEVTAEQPQEPERASTSPFFKLPVLIDFHRINSNN